MNEARCRESRNKSESGRVREKLSAQSSRRMPKYLPCGMETVQKMLRPFRTKHQSEIPWARMETLSYRQWLSLLKPLDFSPGISDYQIQLSMESCRLFACTIAYVAGKCSSVTKGWLLYPFLGHWATFGCEEER